jgi:PDZ domain
MLGALLLFALVLARTAYAQDSLHVYYYNGESIEQMSIKGVMLTMSMKDTGRLNQVAVYVDNSSSDAVNVIPSNFTLHQNAPKNEDLTLKSQQEVQKIAARHALWNQVAGGVGTGLSRAKNKVTGKEELASTTPTDYEAQAHWLAHIDELGQRGQTGTLVRSYLRGTTVFPGSKLSGVLWFDRDEACASAVVRVSLGSRIYLFPFPPPDWATTPSNPNNPERGSETAAAKTPPGNPPSAAHRGVGESYSLRAGVLGISGENWAQDSFAGVKILEVDDNSAAALAGLHAGFVITEIDGEQIGSTEDLAAALAPRGPGTRVYVTYLVRTNLGWMAKQTTVILGRGD